MMIFNQRNLFLFTLLLAIGATCDVQASKVSESQVASDLTLASGGLALTTTSKPAPSSHLLHNIISTISPSLHHTVKSDAHMSISVKKDAPTTLTPHSSSVSTLNDLLHHSSTESPTVAIVDKNKVSTEIISPSTKPIHIPANNVSQISKFHNYLKPICEVVDKIQSKQLSKIQSQFKQLVHLSTGKLATCFLDSYKFDPTSAPITGHNLKAICSSGGKLTAELPNLFETCAKHNWSPLIDQELDKISAARLNHGKNHLHSKDESLAILEHDEEDEVSFISGVVNKFFGSEKSIANTSSDVSVLDISITTTKPKTTVAPLTSTPPSQSISPTSGAPSLMSDPNTFVVFVESTSTTSLPSLQTVVQTSSHKPTGIGELPLILNATTMSPTKSLGLVMSTSQPSESTTIIGPSSTSIPSLAKIQASTSTAKAPVGTKVNNSPVSTSITPLASISTTEKSDAIKKISKGQTEKISSTSKPSIVTTSTVKPVSKAIDTFEEILKRQEKEKQELEMKLKSEREKFMKQLQKKQDEIDAQIAVKALQHQRDAATGHSDAKLHQIEHERQMSIDPIGHTLKHQQYELNKQQKLFAGK